MMKQLTSLLLAIMLTTPIDAGWVQLSGQGTSWPEYGWENTPATYLNSSTLDATGEKIALLGQVWFPARTGNKTISRVGIHFGTVVKAGGSGLTVSLQDVSTTSGPPGQPDGTQDQTVAVANGNSFFASNTWLRTDEFSAGRTVAFGEMLAVVVEFDGSGRQGSDTFTLRTIQQTNTALVTHRSQISEDIGSGWAKLDRLPNMVIEFSDGTFGTLGVRSAPWSALNSHVHNSGSETDEYAMAFTVPVKMKVDGGWFMLSLSGDCEAILYSGTTALATVTLDANTASQTAGRVTYVNFTGEIELSPSTQYYWAIRPTTGTNLSVYSYDVTDANHLTTVSGGTSFTYATRVNQGAWASATSTRRLVGGLRISAIDDGSGGAGSAGGPIVF